MQSLYDEWADQYDQDLTDKSYRTPQRVANMLAHWLPDRSQPILDYGCGTGLSGTALADVGFTQIDGADLSRNMLAIARQKCTYQQLWQIGIEQPFQIELNRYRALVAVGVISVGGAPGTVYDDLVDALCPGMLMVFSMNDQSLQMPEYAGRLETSLSTGKVRVLAQDYGPHVSQHGENSGAMIYVLEALANTDA